MKLEAEQENQEVCIICEQAKQNGIHLYHAFICNECEDEMVHTETGDPRYLYFIRQLKAIKAPRMYS
ncbi:sigma factor G inhibitor Gin [Heyndrickxia acidiproducens]|uniref:sigma factor G inhibitor Gin n=1 Tax=Heyndrickxia acidiproducens TaxID=1121084 RepID=UPI00037B5526|nr:sigma factor G inhibitor Gin [Heyndrickxia acidiproducens]